MSCRVEVLWERQFGWASRFDINSLLVDRTHRFVGCIHRIHSTHQAPSLFVRFNTIVNHRFRILSSLMETNAPNPAAIVYFKSILSTLLLFTTKEKGSAPAVKAQETAQQIVSVLTDSLNHRKHIPLQAEVLKPVYVSFVSRLWLVWLKAPSYEQDFVPGKVLHPNKEHIRKRELLKQVKREKRGVEREMRREAEVISEVEMEKWIECRWEMRRREILTSSRARSWRRWWAGWKKIRPTSTELWRRALSRVGEARSRVTWSDSHFLLFEAIVSGGYQLGI